MDSLRGFGRCGALVVLAATSGPARAGATDVFGFGAGAIGRGGGGVALWDGAQDVSLNPASLQHMEQGQVMLGYGLIRSAFDPIPPVWWDTNRDGRIDDTDTPLDIGPHYDPADGFQFALGRPVGKRFGLAINGFLPQDRILRLQTVDPSLPTYFLYQNRLNRYELSAGFGWEQIPGLSIGGAVEVIVRGTYRISMTADATVRGAGQDDQQAGDLVERVTLDVHEMTFDLVPSLAPVAGVLWDAGELVPALDGWSLGATWRGAAGLPISVDIDLQAELTAQDVGTFQPTAFSLVAPIELAVFDHYLPEQYTGGIAWRAGRTFRAYADLRHTRWDRFQANVAQVVGGEVESQLIQLSDPAIHDGNPYTLNMRATTGFRTGLELTLPRVEPTKEIDGQHLGSFQGTVRGGWGMEPSPLGSQGADSAFLDAGRMWFAVGAGVAHGAPFDLFGGPVRWDLYAQYHLLAKGALDRSGAGTHAAGVPVDGSAIPIGGHLWAVGLQCSIDHD